MRLWWILLGLVAVIGMLFLLSNPQPEEESAGASPPPSTEQPSVGTEEEGGEAEPLPSESQEESGGRTTKSPKELLAELQPYLCEGAEGEPLPEPERPTLRVAAPCVRVEGLFMFGSRLPQTGDYLLKIWPTKEYLPLVTACGALVEGGVPLGRELIVIVKGEDWPKVEPILQPEGHFRYALSVSIEGPYVYSTETNRHVFTPHCEIHPLQALIALDEQSEESDGGEDGDKGEGNGKEEGG